MFSWRNDSDGVGGTASLAVRGGNWFRFARPLQGGFENELN